MVGGGSLNARFIARFSRDHTSNASGATNFVAVPETIGARNFGSYVPDGRPEESDFSGLSRMFGFPEALWQGTALSNRWAIRQYEH